MNRCAYALGAILLSASASTFAADTVVNFDAVTQNSSVNGFYNGGTDSFGASGPNLGVDFQTGDWIAVSGYGPTSQPNFAYSSSGLGYVNISSGFQNQLSFTYGAFSDTTLNVYSGLNGTGALLTSVNLATNDPNAFSLETIIFSGLAESVQIQGYSNGFGWDDFTFGRNDVPEPSTIALMGLAFAGMAACRRKLA